jgi:hypothetical protein
MLDSWIRVTSRNLKTFVILAKAGTQSFVYSKPTNGLGPGLRRGDEFFRSSHSRNF